MYAIQTCKAFAYAAGGIALCSSPLAPALFNVDTPRFWGSTLLPKELISLRVLIWLRRAPKLFKA